MDGENAEGDAVSYTVSQDKTSGLWYVHMKGYAYVPVFGTFRETKKEAKKLLKYYNQRSKK